MFRRSFIIECIGNCMWFFKMCGGGGLGVPMAEVAGGVRFVFLCVCDGFVFCIHL